MSDVREIQVQVHLAEYSALRNEMLSLIKWRDSLVFISLGISGAIFSFVFSRPEREVQSHWTALYLVTPLSTIVGGLWMVNGWRIVRIGKYLQEVISIKLNELIKAEDRRSAIPIEPQLMLWESSNQRLKYKWRRRGVEWFIYLMTFVVSGVLAQLLLLRNEEGNLLYRFKSLEFRFLYLVNAIMLIVAFLGFMSYLLQGSNYKQKPQISMTR